jgi:flagellar biogenesis protein FliO
LDNIDTDIKKQAEKEIRKKKLEEELDRLQKEKEEFSKKRKYYIFVGAVILVLAFVLYLILFKIFNLYETALMLSSALILYGVVALAKALQYFPVEIEDRIFQIQNELDLLSIEDNSIEERAEKLFRLHQYELKKYYDQTLKHSKWIFIIGIISIAAGFLFIGISFLMIIKFPEKFKTFSDKALIGILGSLGAILSNFVAVIFVRMYSETIKSLTEFHNRLVITHYLHFSNFLVSKIKDEKLREETLSKLANEIILIKNK